jgi:hypothetical protein
VPSGCAASCCLSKQPASSLYLLLWWLNIVNLVDAGFVENVKQQTWPNIQDPDEVLLHGLFPDIKTMNTNLCYSYPAFAYIQYIDQQMHLIK